MAKCGCKIEFQQFDDGSLCKAWTKDGNKIPVEIHNNIPWIKMKSLPPQAITSTKQAMNASTNAFDFEMWHT